MLESLLHVPQSPLNLSRRHIVAPLRENPWMFSLHTVQKPLLSGGSQSVHLKFNGNKRLSSNYHPRMMNQQMLFPAEASFCAKSCQENAQSDTFPSIDKNRRRA